MTWPYEFRALGDVNYEFVSSLAIKLAEWEVKSFSQGTNLTQTSILDDTTNTKTETKGDIWL